MYSEEFSSCVNTVKAAVDQVSVELDGMCTQYSWLNQVWHFITHWEGRDRAADMTAEEYEVSCILVYVKKKAGQYDVECSSRKLSQGIFLLHFLVGCV